MVNIVFLRELSTLYTVTNLQIVQANLVLKTIRIKDIMACTANEHSAALTNGILANNNHI